MSEAGKAAVAAGVKAARRRAPKLKVADAPKEFVKPWPENCPVELLGHHNGDFYFLDAAKQFITLPREKLVHAHLRALFGDQINLLYETWPRLKLGEDGWITTGWRPEQVAESAIQGCWAIGVIDVDKQLRGAGAWADDQGRLIWHCGDQVILTAEDGPLEFPPSRLGAYIYARAPALPRPWRERVTADASPAWELLKLLNTWRFARGDLGALLLLGWIGAALIGGALAWRPVTWITGDTATGKSTLLKLIRAVIGRAGLIDMVDTSAAGIWQQVRISTRPVIVDELESEQDNRKVHQVVKLARVAASGGLITRGGQDHKPIQFEARSCFAFLSIVIPPLSPQDRNRMIILELEKLDSDAPAPKLDADQLGMWGQMLRRRLLQGWHRLPALIEAYGAALTARGHIQRGAAVFGTALACAELLLHDLDPADREIDRFSIEALADRLRPGDAIETSDNTSDQSACLARLTNYLVESQRGGSSRAYLEWIEEAARDDTRLPLGDESGEGAQPVFDARRHISRHGCKVVALELDERGDQVAVDKNPRAFLAVANQHPFLELIYRGTHWAARSDAMGPWVMALRRLPGAVTPKKPLHFAGGTSRCVLVPLALLRPRPDAEEAS